MIIIVAWIQVLGAKIKKHYYPSRRSEGWIISNPWASLSISQKSTTIHNTTASLETYRPWSTP